MTKEDLFWNLLTNNIVKTLSASLPMLTERTIAEHSAAAVDVLRAGLSFQNAADQGGAMRGEAHVFYCITDAYWGEK